MNHNNLTTTQTGIIGNWIYPTVVIVEDQSSTRTLFRTIIQAISTNLNILDFESGEQALDLLGSPPLIVPRLLIVDYQIPNGLNGLEFINKYFSFLAKKSDNDDSLELPVAILITAYSDKLPVQMTTSLVDYLLLKPVRPRELQNKCRQVLTGERGSRHHG